MSAKEQEESPTVVEDPEPIPDEIQSDDSEETLPEEPPEKEVRVVPVKRKYTRRAQKETIKTSDENVEVVIKTRKKGPKKRVVTVYKEDIPVDPIQIVEKVKRKPGRPKKPVVELFTEPNEEDCIVF